MVARVVDSDTVDVILDGQTIRVRLIGIDTPETVDPQWWRRRV
jgi:endonuclease YncB( thermonuclease family)